MTDNIFGPDDTPDDLSVYEPIDPAKNYLEELVGPGKKFASVEELAKGKAESDLHIARVEREKKEIKKDLDRLWDENNTRARLEEVLDRLSKTNMSASNDGELLVDANATSTPAINPEQIEEIVASKLADVMSRQEKVKNLQSVKDKLQERFGSNYRNVLKDQANKLGLTDEHVANLAQTSPAALFSMLKLDEAPQNVQQYTPPRNVRSFAPNVNAGKKTMSYYNDLRETNPKMYWDPRTQMERHNAAQEAVKKGDNSFFDSDD